MKRTRSFGPSESHTDFALILGIAEASSDQSWQEPHLGSTWVRHAALRLRAISRFSLSATHLVSTSLWETTEASPDSDVTRAAHAMIPYHYC